MKVNISCEVPASVGEEPISEVEVLVYLGSAVDKHSGTDQDVKARIGKARTFFAMLKKVSLTLRLWDRAYYLDTS